MGAASPSGTQASSPTCRPRCASKRCRPRVRPCDRHGPRMHTRLHRLREDHRQEVPQDRRREKMTVAVRRPLQVADDAVLLIRLDVAVERDVHAHADPLAHDVERRQMVEVHHRGAERRGPDLVGKEVRVEQGAAQCIGAGEPAFEQVPGGAGDSRRRCNCDEPGRMLPYVIFPISRAA